ncbi:MAG TPA: lysozyme [Jatrophihabitans sp.]|nr:lysozyme [Jatrophihabitans sp.]
MRVRRPLAALATPFGFILAAVLALIALVAGALAAAGPAGAVTVVRGFDVSHYQGTVNYGTQYSNGARFVYIKATEGTGYTDPSFSANYTNSYRAGFIRGAYHFAHPNSSSGAAQADFFAAHGGGWSADGRTLPPALDIEYNPSGAECYGLSQSAMVSWVRSFSNEIKAKYNKYPMIYTTLDWWTTCTGNSSAFAATNPFWIAKYSSTPPTAPAGTATWTMWQNADAGAFPGDQDQFNGSYSQLQALATNHD